MSLWGKSPSVKLMSRRENKGLAKTNLKNMDKTMQGSGLKIRVRGYFLSELSLLVAGAPKSAKQLSMATIPLCFEFFRCCVDVLQS